MAPFNRVPLQINAFISPYKTLLVQDPGMFKLLLNVVLFPTLATVQSEMDNFIQNYLNFAESKEYQYAHLFGKLPSSRSSPRQHERQIRRYMVTSSTQVAKETNARASFTFETFIHTLRKYKGNYVLGGLNNRILAR